MTHSESTGDLCGVRACSGLQEAAADVPLHGATVELSLCANHLAELHETPDPIAMAQAWVIEATNYRSTT